jgi:hypothetical protein
MELALQCNELDHFDVVGFHLPSEHHDANPFGLCVRALGNTGRRRSHWRGSHRRGNSVLACALFGQEGNYVYVGKL